MKQTRIDKANDAEALNQTPCKMKRPCQRSLTEIPYSGDYTAGKLVYYEQRSFHAKKFGIRAKLDE